MTREPDIWDAWEVKRHDTACRFPPLAAALGVGTAWACLGHEVGYVCKQRALVPWQGLLGQNPDLARRTEAMIAFDRLLLEARVLVHEQHVSEHSCVRPTALLPPYETLRQHLCLGRAGHTCHSWTLFATVAKVDGVGY